MLLRGQLRASTSQRHFGHPSQRTQNVAVMRDERSVHRQAAVRSLPETRTGARGDHPARRPSAQSARNIGAHLLGITWCRSWASQCGTAWARVFGIVWSAIESHRPAFQGHLVVGRSSGASGRSRETLARRSGRVFARSMTLAMNADLASVWCRCQRLREARDVDGSRIMPRADVPGVQRNRALRPILLDQPDARWNRLLRR